MDIQGHNPQPGRPQGGMPPQRPQGYNNPPPRPSIDGFTPPPQAQQTQQTNQPTPTPEDPVHQSPQPDIPPVGPQVLEPTHDHHRSSKPVVLAIITLLIATGLAVAAFFAFRPETAEKVNKVNVPTSSNTESQNTTTTDEAIDSATTDINKQVEGQNDTQDFADTELTDQTLGL